MLGQWTVAAARNFKHSPPPHQGPIYWFIYLFYQLFRHKFEPVCKCSANLCNSVIFSHFATTLGLPAGKMIEGWFLVPLWWPPFWKWNHCTFLHTVNGFSTKWLKSKAKLDFGSRYYREGKKTLAKLKFSLYATFITFDLSPPRCQSRNRNRCQHW